MDGTVFTALVSGAVALATVTITQPISYFFSKKRDHEADWRKMKLEQYKEYVAAFSGTVHHPYDSVVQRRYSDAVNSMGLVASPKVLDALYEFLDETSFRNDDRTPQKYDSLLSSLMRAMREDSHPEPPNDSSDFTFRTLDCPPDLNEDSNPDVMRSERTTQ
jgi:hypothetical protein